MYPLVLLCGLAAAAPSSPDAEPNPDPAEDGPVGAPAPGEANETPATSAAAVDAPEDDLRRTTDRVYEDRGIELGTRYRFGLGVAAGFPPSVTARYLPSRRDGVSLHIGPTMVTTGLHLRLQYERRIVELPTAGWSFGSLGLTWHLGLVASLVFGQEVEGRPVRPGITTGLGVELAFNVAPVAVFGEVSPVLYPLDLIPATRTAYLPAGLTVVVGARFYLDVSRRRASRDR